MGGMLTGAAGTGGMTSGAAGTGGTTTGGAGTGGAATGGRGGSGTAGTAMGGRGGTGTAGTAAGGRGGGTAGATGGAGAGGSSGGRGGATAGTTGTAGTGGTAGTVARCAPGVGGRAFMCGPAIASGAAGEIDVFAVGADGKVRWRQYAAGWSSWQLVSGSETITSDIDVSEVGFSVFDLLGLGAAGNVVHQHWTSAGWLAAWENFSAGEPTVTPALYGVATTLTGNTQSSNVSAWAFTTGSNGALLTRNANSSRVWSAWTGLQGSLSSAPDAVSRVGVTWVVARGASPADIVINKNATNLDGPGQWSGFTALPRLPGNASFTHGPCITAGTDSRLDVFVPGGGTTLWHNTSTNGGANWNLPLWEDLGGGPTIVSAPDCVAPDSNTLDVVVVGADGHVWRRAFAGAPSTWEDLGVYTN